MIECTFELNGKPMSVFKMSSREFPAFSGLNNHANRPEFVCSANSGAIPLGSTIFWTVSQAEDWERCAHFSTIGRTGSHFMQRTAKLMTKPFATR